MSEQLPGMNRTFANLLHLLIILHIGEKRAKGSSDDRRSGKQGRCVDVWSAFVRTEDAGKASGGI